jgi:hypothetical protein
VAPIKMVYCGWWLVDRETCQPVCEYVPQWWGREKGTVAMSIVESAKAELERINFGAEDTAAMVDILERFFKQWDSGGAVACVAPILMRCISGQPLSPLTGADDEWHDPMGDGLMLQNVRCGSVFKDYRNADGELALGGAELIHDIDAPDPRAPITFPYDPTTRAPLMPVFEVDVPGALANGDSR